MNVAMIESTNAFKKFANGKHWDQLDFRIQQQIRLQAILEQANARYGNSLQNSVMTKQGQLSEQLKDIKLNLSLAFLPIWEKILPALSALASALVDITDKIARFSFWLTGKNYDEATKGTDQQTRSVENMGDAYKEAGDKAADSLAAFDEINKIGDLGGGSGTGSGGSGSNGPGSNANGGNNGNPFDVPALPPFPNLQLKFDPPDPPDAGIGGVATAITATVNQIIGNMRAATQQIDTAWADMLTQMAAVTVPGLQPALAGWNAFNAAITLGSQTTSASTQLNWHTMLDYMQVQLNAYNPYLIFGWNALLDKVNALKPASVAVSSAWHEMLDSMQVKINAYQPYLSFGLSLIGLSLSGLQTAIDATKTAWNMAWDGMYSFFHTKTSQMLSEIEAVRSAFVSLQATMGQPVVQQNLVAMPANPNPFPVYQPSTPTTSTAPATTSVPVTDPNWGRDIPYLGAVFRGLDSFRETDFSKWIADHPELGTLVGTGGLSGLSGSLGGLESGATNVWSKLKGLLDSLGGLGNSVPALASGGITTGPMLAMIGDNVGGQEVVSPLGDLMDMIQSAVATAVMTASQFSQNNQPQGDIILQIDGTAFARITNPYAAKENSRIGGAMIRTT